ncbi:MAG: hypothetical protein JSV09_13300, partial [Thermoplasmata archaeon]
DERNYWSSAETDDLGNDPLNGVTQVIENSSVGTNYTHIFHLPLSANALRVTDVVPPGVVDPKYRMNISFEVEANIMSVENSYTGEHGDLYGPSGNIDFFIADSLNYNLYVNDLSYNAYRVLQRISSEDLAFLFPNEDRHYVVLSNEFSQETTKIVNITVNIYSAISVDITSPGNGSEFNQGQTVIISGTSWSPIGVINVRVDIDDQGSWQYAIDTSSAEQDPYTTWEFYWYTSSYKPGLHKVTAMASDHENSTTDSININLKDVSRPNIEIEIPYEGAIYWLGEFFLLNGTANDNGWIDVLELIIDSDDANSIDLIPYLDGDTFSYELYANDLGYGEHNLTVWVSDTASNFNSDTVNIRIFESVPPEVRINTPSEGSIFRPGDTILISGTASDNMEYIFLEIVIDSGDPIDITSELNEDGFWSYYWETESTSPDGEHDIEIRAEDGSYNVATDTVTVILDGTSPEIVIESPTEGSIWRIGDILNTYGTVIDDTSIQSLELIIDSDDANAIDLLPYLVDGFWSYDISTNDFDYGDHTITIWTNDIVSNYASMDRNFRILEIVEPDVRIDIPLNGSIFKPGDFIDIFGMATDNWEIVSLEIIIDGQATINIISSLMEDGLWYYNWSTESSSEGEHIIEIIATDASGNVATDTITVILDGTDPEAEILIPMDYQIFKTGDYITFQGTASDDWKLSKVELILDNKVWVDITNKAVGGIWEYELMDTNDLTSGEHIITVSATDSVGNNYKTSVIIRIDAQEPEIEITPIEEDPINIGDTLLIKGFAWDDIEVHELVLVIDDNIQINLAPMPSNGYWEYRWDTTSLSEGEHTISIMATDYVENHASSEIEVILYGNAPVASIGIPMDGQVFKAGESIYMEGSASDDWDLKKVELIIDDGKSSDITWKIMDGQWNHEYRDTRSLERGEHKITVSATDSVGQNSMASITVLIDSEEPEVEITTDVDSVEMGEPLVLQGTALDDIEVEKLYLVIDDNEIIDITFKLINGNWEYQLDTSDMLEGRHTFSIMAFDRVDNEAFDDIRIKFVQETTDLEESGEGSVGESDEEGFLESVGTEMIALIVIIIVLILLVLVVSKVLIKKGK